MNAVVNVLDTVVVVIFPIVVAGIVGSARAFSRARDRGRG